MVGPNAIFVGQVIATLIMCYDSRYLLVNIGERNVGDMKAISNSWHNENGNIGSNLCLKSLRTLLTKYTHYR